MPAPIIAAYNPFLKDHAPVELRARRGGADRRGRDCRLRPSDTLWRRVGRSPRGRRRPVEPELTRLRDQLGVQTRILADASVPRALHTLARDEAASLIVVGSTARGYAGASSLAAPPNGSCTGHRAPSRLPRAATSAPRSKPSRSASSIRPRATPHSRSRTCSPGGRTRNCASSPRSIPPARWTRPRRSTPPPRGLALEGRHRASVEATLNAALNALPAGVEVEPEIHVDDPAEVLLRCVRTCRTARLRLPRLRPAAQRAAGRRLAPARRRRAMPRPGPPARGRPAAPGPVQ